MILNHEDILEILPHRYPMLLVDRIVELEPMNTLWALKMLHSTNCSSKVTSRQSSNARRVID